MKTKGLFGGFLVLMITMSSCILSPSISGNGNVEEENRSLGGFDEIKVSRGMNVYIAQGPETKVVVKADENLLDAIETVVEGDVLVVTCRANIRHAKAKAVYVTLPNLEHVRATAGSNVYSEDTIHTDDLEVSATAGSNIKLKLTAGHIDASVSAGSNIRMEGSTGEIVAKASSGSNIKAEELKAESAEVKVSSGANIWITAGKELNAAASSGGNIFYSGNPSDTNISKSSGGNVIKN
jgi:hypothetical protein